MKWLDRIPAVALSVLLASAGLAQERYNTEEFREACDALMCQCGCNSTISTCAMEHCHSAEPIREEIAERLQSGESVESVIDVFRDRYGLAILSAPPAEGFHLTAWVTPFLALAVGLFVLAFLLRSWSRRTPVTEDGPVVLSDAQRARIERDLRDISS